MATRFYLPSAGTPAVTPASFNSSWSFTSSAVILPTSITTSGTAITLSSVQIPSYSGGTQYECIAQYISAPITSQIFAGTISGQIYPSESNSDFDAMRAVTVRIMSNDGTTETGVLLADFPTLLASEYAAGASGTSEVNRNYPPSTAVVGITSNSDDRIVIEIGYTSFKTGSTRRFARHYLGDDQATDAPVNETDTDRTTNNPWIEFSQDITFAGAPPATTSFTPRLTLMGCG